MGFVSLIVSSLLVFATEDSKPTWEQVDFKFFRDMRKLSLKFQVADRVPGETTVDYEIFRFRLLRDQDVSILKGHRSLNDSTLLVDLKDEVRYYGAEGWRPGDSYYVVLKFKREGQPESEPLKSERLEAPQ